MRTQEVRLNYQEAIQLIRVGHYEEALELLYGVDKARPNVKNVLFPMVVCCEKLGHVEEALDYCDRLIKDHDHDKAKEIKTRLLSSIPFPEEAEISQPAETESESPNTEESYPLPQADNPSESNVAESPEEAQEETVADTVTETAEEIAETPLEEGPPPPTRHRSPLWLVLIIALIAAAITAGLIHYFLLKSYWQIF